MQKITDTPSCRPDDAVSQLLWDDVVAAKHDLFRRPYDFKSYQIYVAHMSAFAAFYHGIRQVM